MSHKEYGRPRHHLLACVPGPKRGQDQLFSTRMLKWQRFRAESHAFVHENQTEPYTSRSQPASDTDSSVVFDQHDIKHTASVLTSSTPSKSDTQGHRVWHVNEKYWLTEVGSCLVALGVFVALVCVLRQHDSKPLPEWKYDITLNALVSVLTSIFKAAVVLPLAGGISQAKWRWYERPRPLKDLETFDDASRGPWGSIILMLELRSHYVASFGAFLTVIAMAVDPFAQQIVQTQPCQLKDTLAVARIPRANIYNQTVRTATDAFPGKIDIHPALAVAIYKGLIDPPDNVSSIISPICPSGNCTFPEHEGSAYRSIAMCHQCDDITGLIKVTTNSSDKSIPMSIYSLPSGINLTGDHSLAVTTRNSTPKTDFDPPFYFETLMYTNNSESDLRKDSAATGLSHLLGARCSLYPCLKSYGAQILRGSLQEHELSRENLEWQAERAVFAMVSDNVTYNGMSYDCSTTAHWTPENTFSLLHGAAFDINSYLGAGAIWTDLAWTSEDCYWEFGGPTSNQIQRMLGELFNNKSLGYQGGYSESSGDVWLTNLFQDGAANLTSIDQFMGSIAYSITAQMRTEGYRGLNSWAEGAVLLDRTCVKVNWPWLALPTVLLVLVPVFIGLAVISTLRARWREHGPGDEAAASRIGFLKSTPLALMFFGLHRNVLDEKHGPADAVTMRDIAQNVDVSLKWCSVEGQWQFVKSKESKD